MKTKILLLDAANTIIHKPNLWVKIIEVFNQHHLQINLEKLKYHHKLISEIINFPDRTDEEFYNYFNSELLISLGVLPNNDILKDLFSSCSYLPWEVFEDVKELNKLDIPKVVLSNFNNTLENLLTKLIGDNIFTDIIVSEKESIRKPSIDFYKMVLKRHCVQPSEILYIGDSIKLDIIPATKIGFNSLLIDRDDFYPNVKNKIRNFGDVKTHL